MNSSSILALCYVKCIEHRAEGVKVTKEDRVIIFVGRSF